MKALIMCEGPNELAVIQMLLDNERLIFSEDDLLGLRPYYAKQLNSAIKTELNIYPGNDVCIFRIGDTLTDELKIPSDYKGKIERVERYCTKPELEILLIISEDKWDEYNKDKSKIMPKEFAKMNVKCDSKRYDNSTKFYEEYFKKYGYDKLVWTIEEYKRLKKHKKGEHFLAELLK